MRPLFILYSLFYPLHFAHHNIHFPLVDILCITIENSAFENTNGKSCVPTVTLFSTIPPTTKKKLTYMQHLFPQNFSLYMM